MLVVAKSETDQRWLSRHRLTSPSIADAFDKMSAGDQAEVDRLLRETNRAAVQIRQQFLDAIAKVRDRLDAAKLEEYLRLGRVQDAIDYVNSELFAGGYQRLASTVTDALIVSGQAAALAAQVPQQIQFTFGVVNPATVDYLRTAELNLIRQMSADTRAQVLTVIRDGILAGRNPIDVARDLRGFVGLTDRQTQAVLNYRRMLEAGDTAALQRALHDQRFGLSNLTPDKIDRMVERYRERYLKYRAETIARTEAIRAVNKGNHLLWQQAVDDGKLTADQVTRKWIYTHDSKTRHAHRTIPFLNPDGVGLNEPFQTELGPLMFPGDPNGTAANTINCRCTVVTRFRS